MVQLLEEDVSAINNVLEKLRLTTIATEEHRGNITPVAIRILQYTYHFIRWGNNQLRSPSEIGQLISLDSFAQRIMKAEPNELAVEIENLFSYAIDMIKQNYGQVFGLESAIGVIYETLELTDELFATFDWTVIDIRNSTIVLHMGPLSSHGMFTQAKIPLLEGMMAATAVYPQIHYQAGLDELVVIPKYDSGMKLQSVDETFDIGKYRVLLPAQRLTDRYLSDLALSRPRSERRNNALPALEQGYLVFDSLDFLRGMISMSATIGVDQPWIRLDVLQDGVWKDAVAIPSSASS